MMNISDFLSGLNLWIRSLFCIPNKAHSPFWLNVVVSPSSPFKFKSNWNSKFNYQNQMARSSKIILQISNTQNLSQNSYTWKKTDLSKVIEQEKLFWKVLADLHHLHCLPFKSEKIQTQNTLN